MRIVEWNQEAEQKQKKAGQEQREAGRSSNTSLWTALHLDKTEFPCVIAIVGSGGKTSLMGQLAKEGRAHNLQVAVLTTTHIRKPPEYQEVFSQIENKEDDLVQSGAITIYGADCGDEKITYPGDACYEAICCHSDFILVEADGSRGLPIKYPAKHEPVIPANVNKILCVCGMSGLGHPGAEVCHRWELAKEKIQKAEQELVTEQMITELLETGYGKPLQQTYPEAEFYYCMNQADTPGQQAAAARILGMTGRKGIILSLHGEENVMYEERGADT